MYIRGFLGWTMVTVKQIDLASAIDFKTVRLNALKDSPFAFGSTYEKESHLSDAEWQKRTAERDGTKSITYLAWDQNGQPCGIAAGFLDADNRSKAHLVSVWVAPESRQSGVGRLLVSSVIIWAKSRQVSRLNLMVTSNNQTAIAFYQRIGFTKTGRIEPYPNDPSVTEFEMTTEILAR